MNVSDVDAVMGAVDSSGLAVLVLTDSLTPTHANRSARLLLGLPDDTLPARVQPDALLSVARQALRTSGPVEASVSVDAASEVRVWAQKSEPEDHVVLLLTDITRQVQAHHLRRQFVLAASHELKTPVAGIRALAETVSEALENDVDTARLFARKLVIESERLTQLINALLDLSRVEDPAHYSNSLVDLGAVAQREAEALRVMADERRVKFLVDVAADVPMRGDDQQLGLLVRNLVDNAIHYTAAEGSVHVRLKKGWSEAILEVEDTGEGIPLNAQARVFERFFRVDQDRARTSGGTGLGLSIVKHVAELHGGRVSLRSELGEGSTFTVQLPLAEAR